MRHYKWCARLAVSSAASICMEGLIIRSAVLGAGICSGHCQVPTDGADTLVLALGFDRFSGTECCIDATKSAPLAASIQIVVEHGAIELAY